MITVLLFAGCLLVFGGLSRWLERAAEADEPPPPDPLAEPAPPRQVRPATPLPRRLRRHHLIPEHTADPPLTDAELIQLASEWPHLVSAYYRESHHR